MSFLLVSPFAKALEIYLEKEGRYITESDLIVRHKVDLSKYREGAFELQPPADRMKTILNVNDGMTLGVAETIPPGDVEIRGHIHIKFNPDDQKIHYGDLDSYRRYFSSGSYEVITTANMPDQWLMSTAIVDVETGKPLSHALLKRGEKQSDFKFSIPASSDYVVMITALMDGGRVPLYKPISINYNIHLLRK
jgi:hypothetical protein